MSLDSPDKLHWFDEPCRVEIPGIGLCTLKYGEHEIADNGNPVHRRGAISWNGVDDAKEVQHTSSSENQVEAAAEIRLGSPGQERSRAESSGQVSVEEGRE